VISGKDNMERSFAKTKELFSALGKHRNIEISKQLLLSFSGNKEQSLNPVLIYFQLLQDQLKEFCRKSIEHYDEKELSVLTIQLEQGLKDLTAEDTRSKTNDLVTSSMKNVKHDLKHFNERSHLVRKELKNIFYWAKIFEDDGLLTKAQMRSIDKILEHLGNIQDHEVMIGNLKNFRKTILSKGVEEYEFIKKIEARAERKKNVLLEKAKHATEQLVDS
jgi:CHAD domain-containing protein